MSHERKIDWDGPGWYGFHIQGGVFITCTIPHTDDFAAGREFFPDVKKLAKEHGMHEPKWFNNVNDWQN